MTTQIPTRVIVTTDSRACTAPPKTVVAARCVAAPSATHSGHWKPTDAGRMQSGHTGRSHRAQRT